MRVPAAKKKTRNLIVRIPSDVMDDFESIVNHLKKTRPNLKWSLNAAIVVSIQDWIESWKVNLDSHD